MDLQDWLNKKTDRLNDVPEEFVNSMSNIETKVSQEIEALVSELETVNGELVLSDKNMALIENINQRVKNIIFNDEYEKSLTKYIGEYGKQAELNDKYFRVINGEFEAKPLYQSVLRSTQRNAIELLSEDAFTQALIMPLKQTLESSITNSVSFTETMKNLRYVIQGDDEIDGRLMAHVKRVAYDSFAVSDRAYTNTISVDLGLEFYRYTGGKISETRCFCENRLGKFFHKKEIEGWGEGKGVGECGYPWQGMNTNTDKATIFYYAGGYNCKHSILPVSLKSVPKEDIERAKKSGSFKE